MSSLQESLSRLPEILRSRVRLQERLAPYTSFKIGGPADLFFEPLFLEEVSQIAAWAQAEGIPVTWLGNGSNLVVSDRGIRGLVVVMAGRFSQLEALGREEAELLYKEVPELETLCESYPQAPVYCDFGQPPVLLRVRAGTALADASAWAKEHGLAGLEFACGIPGTAGGAVFMNAGAYGNSIQDVTVLTRAMTRDGRCHWVTGPEHRFGYRSSLFSESGRIVLETYFCLRPGRFEEIENLVTDYTNRRTTSQPLELPSAGSMFKRPHGYFAGKLISEAGLKGLRVGDAAVSEKHAGFVVNLGEARAEDVRALVKQIQSRVWEASGVRLETEVRFIGDWDSMF